MTHRLVRHDTVSPARSMRVAWAMGVCTPCAQPSFDSVHYFESLFETLFMNTFHEYCSRGFKKKKKKKKSNKIFQNKINFLCCCI